jgi:hypothetical protein
MASTESMVRQTNGSKNLLEWESVIRELCAEILMCPASTRTTKVLCPGASKLTRDIWLMIVLPTKLDDFDWKSSDDSDLGRKS